MRIIDAELAGSWYPSAERDCRREIEGYIGRLPAVSLDGLKLIGGIVPHAGWLFSGDVACAVYNALKSGESPEVVVIFGSHLSPTSRNWIVDDGAWETPLGNLPINSDIAGKLKERFDFSDFAPILYAAENTIEVQLPFIKFFFPDTTIVPVGVAPREECIEIGKAAAELIREAGGRGLVIGSTDLTHYGPNYGFIPRGTGAEAVEWVKQENDKSVVDKMVAMDASGVIADGLSKHNACCPGAAAAAIAAAKELGATAGKLLIYKTSYDVRPDASFVGYAAVVY